MTKPAYQLRVIEEREALDVKITSLGIFIAKRDGFALLPQVERARMITQHHIMRAYLTILDARIDAFDDGTPAAAPADPDLTSAIAHLNSVTSLINRGDQSAVIDASLFLLRMHRERGTPIRASVFDYAVNLERNAAT